MIVLLDNEKFPPREGVWLMRVVRNAPGSIACNIEREVIHHSPSGWEYGYGGSGPADLALSICHYYAREMGMEGGTEIQLFEGTTSHFVWSIHQEFKRHFIVPLSRNDNHMIEASRIRAWVNSAWRAYNQSEEGSHNG